MNHLNIQFCFLRRLYHVIIARIEREVSYNRDDLGSNRGQTKLLIERVDIVLQGGTGNRYYDEYRLSFAGISLDSERLHTIDSTQFLRRVAVAGLVQWRRTLLRTNSATWETY